MSNANDNKFRQLSSHFIQDLKGSNKEIDLSPLTDLVKKDHSLSLEIRNN